MENLRYWATITVKALAITFGIIAVISILSDMLFAFYPSIWILMIIILPFVFILTVYFS